MNVELFVSFNNHQSKKGGKKMVKRYLLMGLLAVFLGISSVVYAAESDLTLEDNTANSGFSVKKADGSTIARFGGNGNVGIGTTGPVAADSSARTLQIGNQMIFQNVVGSQNSYSRNAYYNGTNWYYATTGYASAIRMNDDPGDGSIIFHVAPSGTAGNTISNWDGSTRAMTIRNSGNVGIGTTGPGRKLELSGDFRLSYAPEPSIYYMDIVPSGAASDVRYDFIMKDYGGLQNVAAMTIKGQDGNVGIGTTEPAGALHIVGSGADNTPNVNGVQISAGSDGNAKIELTSAASGTPYIDFQNDISGIDYDMRIRLTGDDSLAIEGGNVGIGTTSPQHPLHMGSGAHVTAAGVWTNASSREYKENIRDLTTDEAMQTLDGLRPTRFNYKVDKEDEYIGFIAEDVPDLVATRDRKGLSPMDLTAVLTKVVQAQQKMLLEQKEAMSEMKEEIKTLKSVITYGVKGL